MINSHNDLPWNIRKFLKNQLREFRFGEDLRDIAPWSTSLWSHTDLHRLKEGMVAAQVSIDSYKFLTSVLSSVVSVQNYNLTFVLKGQGPLNNIYSMKKIKVCPVSGARQIFFYLTQE